MSDLDTYLAAVEERRTYLAAVEERRDPEKQCRCPPWVLRCVHVDGTILVLMDHTLAPQGCAEPYSVLPRYGVGAFRRWSYCEECGQPAFWTHDLLRPGPYKTEDEDAAIAEFHRRAEMLRTGGAPC